MVVHHTVVVHTLYMVGHFSNKIRRINEDRYLIKVTIQVVAIKIEEVLKNRDLGLYLEII